MTTELVTVDPATTLIEAARAMSAGHARSVLVVQDGSLVGIFTERDMLRAMAQSSKADAARVLSVSKWMTRDPLTVAPDTPVGDALDQMLSGGFRHLPVMEADAVVGVVSMRDLARSISKEGAALHSPCANGHAFQATGPVPARVGRSRGHVRKLHQLDGSGRQELAENRGSEPMPSPSSSRARGGASRSSTGRWANTTLAIHEATDAETATAVLLQLGSLGNLPPPGHAVATAPEARVQPHRPRSCPPPAKRVWATRCEGGCRRDRAARCRDPKGCPRPRRRNRSRSHRRPRRGDTRAFLAARRPLAERDGATRRPRAMNTYAGMSGSKRCSPALPNPRR